MGFTFETVVKIILLILALRALHMVSANNSCSEVRRNFVAKRIGNMRLVPYNALQTSDLAVCPNTGFTCCTRAMETKFQVAAKKDVEKVLKFKISSLKYNFKSLSENFRDDVDDLFYTAKNSTKNILRKFLDKKRTKIVMQSVMNEVDQLFKALKLRSEEDEVMKAFNRFANQLFLIFMDDSFNGFNFDSAYEECVVQQRDELRPFMGLPTITAANMSRALELAATFHEALKVGSEAVNVTEGAALSKSCQESLLKMQYCSHCLGLTLLKPCMGLCRNTLRGCLAGVTEMNGYWNFYITSLVEVTSRMRSMDSRHNLEYALEDFKNKFAISLSHIMENSSTLQETVEKRCQKYRTLKRSKRSADLSKTKIPEEGGNKNEKRRSRHGRKLRKRTRELLKLKEEKILPAQALIPPLRTKVLPPHKVLFNNPPRERPRKATPQQIVEIRSTTALHSRIRRFITSLNLFVNFYRDLPDDMCQARSSVTIEVVNHGKCWDGADIVEQYSKDVVQVGFDNQARNPEVEVLKVDKRVIRAIEKLRNTAQTLFVAAGNEEIPALLKSPASYKQREKKANLENSRWPCDDEDDCGELDEEGSSDPATTDLPPEKEHHPKTKPKRRRKNQQEPPLIAYDPAHDTEGQKTHIRDSERKISDFYNHTDIFSFEEDRTRVTIESNKGRKNRRKKNRRKKLNPAATPTEAIQTTDGPGGSSSCVRSSIISSIFVTLHLLTASWI